MKYLIIAIASLLTTACGNPNDAPRYGKTGLPKNCRALIQENIDGYRLHQYTADEVMNSLERNCGANGYSWDE